MRRERFSLFDQTDTKVAAYESLLDLFTLISFVLIFAAVIYVTRNTARYEESSLIETKSARSGAGTAQISPHEGFLLTLYREGSKDKCSIKNLESGEVKLKDISAENVGSALAEFLPLMIKIDKTNVAIGGKKALVNANLLFAVQLWLNDQNLKYHLYFHLSDD